MDRKENVRLVDGSEKEITVGFLSGEKRNEIMGKHIKFGLQGKETKAEDINIFGIQNDVLKHTVRGVDAGQIIDEDFDMLYNKYFPNILGSVGGNKGN